jgi:predicted XRE-type DNA-binding protein
VSRTEAAGRLGLTQPRLNDLMRGRIDKFSLDVLINLAKPAGLTVRLTIKSAA